MSRSRYLAALLGVALVATPDSRPDVRENDLGLGNLLADFDFSQPPRAPLILPRYP